MQFQSDSNSDESVCAELVYGFARALNEWNRRFYAVNRIAEGRSINPANQLLANGHTVESCLADHAALFDRFVVPRDRKYGSNPGSPGSWGSDPFCDVSMENFVSVDFLNRNKCCVTTLWGMSFSGGQTMFLLKRIAESWRIDSLKCRDQDSAPWRIAYF